MARSRGVGRSVVGLVAGVVAVLVVGGPAEAGDTHWGAAPVVVASVEPGDTHWGIAPAAVVGAEPGDTHWGAVHDSGPVSLGDSSS
ncbi:hypothetical protein JG491_25675 [Streptomyces sp. CRPSP2-6A1]|uniref:hypothetical protein n=1 Tax=Streptomyces sp. CRPSP2-6A1 TaxID=2799588 RepID=UPI0018F07409|nr:hypothetical protein [Streptomyces sp. CRPSP2-6A1]MBJ7003415.1 hypothetical protein [Streptomyces sp. CRPSP2-6A1]